MEYGLSVIENPGVEKGKSYKEYQERSKGKSWKAKLQYSIDNSIKKRLKDRVSNKEKHADKSQFYRNKTTQNSKFDKVISLKSNAKTKEFKGYEVWAKQHN